MQQEREREKEGGREGNKERHTYRKKETNRKLRSDVSSERREETILEQVCVRQKWKISTKTCTIEARENGSARVKDEEQGNL